MRRSSWPADRPWTAPGAGARSPPAFFHTTPLVVDLVKADGFMSRRPGNSFEYPPIDFHDNVYGDVFERINVPDALREVTQVTPPETTATAAAVRTTRVIRRRRARRLRDSS